MRPRSPIPLTRSPQTAAPAAPVSADAAQGWLPDPGPMDERAGKGNLIEFPVAKDDRGPSPSAPCGHVVTFPKRTEVISIRLPLDLNAKLQRSADRLYMTKSSYCLRVLAEHEEPQELQGLPRKQAVAGKGDR